MLAVEPDMKRGCDHPESSKGSRLFCVFHNVQTALGTSPLHQRLLELLDVPLLGTNRPSTTYTATTPTTVKSSEPFEMDASVDAPSATTRATAEEEDKAEDAWTIVAPARSGATSLARAP